MNDYEFHSLLSELVARYGEDRIDRFVTEVVRRTRVANAQERVGTAVAGALALRGAKVQAKDVLGVVLQGALGMAEALQAGALPQIEPPRHVEARVTKTKVGSTAREIEVEEIIDAEFEEVR